MGKYDHLKDYFSRQTGREFSLSFAEIEDIAGTELPQSARVYAPWWANEAAASTRHVQCRAWREAGYSAFPELISRKVRFVKTESGA